MNQPAPNQNEAVVQIVGPTDGWVLERLARRLATKLPYAEFVPWTPRPTPAARIAYYVNYALYRGSSGLIDVAFFTHLDPGQQFLARARLVDHCVCMSKLYADWLKDRGIRGVTHIPMGFDSYRYRPRLVLGVIGRLDHPRKGQHLVDRLRQLPFVEVVTTEGRWHETDLRNLYQRLDYVLIPATVEGGPMSLLEGLAMGKPVIAPEGVGMVPEFGDSPFLRRYPPGDVDALLRLVNSCYSEKLRPAELVQERAWDRWAEAHHHLFERLLHERGQGELPHPAAGFRFGLLGELDVPVGQDVAALEACLDQVARHLFYGEYRRARYTLMEILPRYPCARKLLATIPEETEALAPCTAVA